MCNQTNRSRMLADCRICELLFCCGLPLCSRVCLCGCVCVFRCVLGAHCPHLQCIVTSAGLVQCELSPAMCGWHKLLTLSFLAWFLTRFASDCAFAASLACAFASSLPIVQKGRGDSRKLKCAVNRNLQRGQGVGRPDVSALGVWAWRGLEHPPIITLSFKSFCIRIVSAGERSKESAWEHILRF